MMPSKASKSIAPFVWCGASTRGSGRVTSVDCDAQADFVLGGIMRVIFLSSQAR
jgi:hypothetical protein